MLICYTIAHFLVTSSFFFFSYLRDIHILSSKNNIAKTGLSVTGLPVEEVHGTLPSWVGGQYWAKLHSKFVAMFFIFLTLDGACQSANSTVVSPLSINNVLMNRVGIKSMWRAATVPGKMITLVAKPLILQLPEAGEHIKERGGKD